jgi:transglutaminase-like putative cysteine protease
LEGEAAVVKYDVAQQQCLRKNQDQRVQFELGTKGIRDGAQHPFTSGPENGFSRGEFRRLTEMPRASGGVDPLARLKATAAQVLADAKIPAANRLQAARALEEFLQSKGGYKYSLAPTQREPQLDPLEDFVSTHKEGHCEFFAGALALMLRSQGIPSRIVIGFKTDEWNALGQFYQVRQLHAHAWVEAYLSPDDLKNVDVDLETDGVGVWLRLDPTATAEATLGTQVLGVLSGARQMFDYVEMLWINYVVALSSEQQQKRIYEPLSFAWSIVVSAFTGSYDKHSWQQRLGARVKGAARWFQGNWFSWRGGLAAAGSCLLGCALLWAGFRLWKLLRAARQQVDGPNRRPASVEFYRRLEELLGTVGLVRQAQQTPREFATIAGGELAETPRLRAAAPLPRHVVDAFYRVRFGRETLDNHDVEAVEHALRDLEASLRQPR